MKIEGSHREQSYCDCNICKKVRKLREKGIHVFRYKKFKGKLHTK